MIFWLFYLIYFGEYFLIIFQENVWKLYIFAYFCINI